MTTILHITTKQDWESAQADGAYHAPSLNKRGFITCTLPDQVLAVANYHYKGRSEELVLVEIDEKRVSAEVKYEDFSDDGEYFPHIYGPLNLDAVKAVHPFEPQQDGTFVLPEGLKARASQ